jgi:hypothetical protein
MSKKNVNKMRPFLSLLIIVGTLFSTVFFKMEVRRMGYLVLKENRAYKNMQDQVRLQVMTYAKVTRPERVRDFAVSQLTLSDARNGQIIHLSDQLAVPQ